MSLITGNAWGAIAPNIDATKFYYPNQEPPAAFLASFRRSVWKSSISFFPGLVYKGVWNLWWTYPFFLTVPIRPFEKKWSVNANLDLKKRMFITWGMKSRLACTLHFWWRVWGQICTWSSLDTFPCRYYSDAYIWCSHWQNLDKDRSTLSCASCGSISRPALR